MEEIGVFLDDIVQFINRTRGDESPFDMDTFATKIASHYAAIKEKEIDYIGIFDSIFENDIQLHLLVLSSIFCLFKEKKVLDKIDLLIQNDKLPYDLVVGIRYQMVSLRFNDKELQVSYKEQRICHSYMVERLRSELGKTLSFIPYKERNHNRIVIATNTLLDDKHAPTGLILKITKTLQENCGYEVLVLVNVENVIEDVVREYWVYNIFLPNYREQEGNFTRLYQGCEIRGFQQIIDTQHFSGVLQIIQQIVEWKPECIWSIGRESIINDVLGDVTTLISTCCTSGYAVSDAPVLTNFALSQAAGFREMDEYIREQGQKQISFTILNEYSVLGKEYSKADFGFPEDAFVIAIVGNRLDMEISSRFIEIMQEIIRKVPNAYFAIIGRCSRVWDNDLANQIKMLGFREDLMDTLKITQIFLNPVRQGGGSSGRCAVAAGVPVITLPNCDVASVGDAFVCEQLDEFPDLVYKYYSDEVFYQSQVEECRKRYEELHEVAVNVGDECQKVIRQVQEWLLAGEIQ